MLIYLIPLQTTLLSLGAIDHFPVLNILHEEIILLHNAPQQPILANILLYYKFCRHPHHGNLCQPQQQTWLANIWSILEVMLCNPLFIKCELSCHLIRSVQFHPNPRQRVNIPSLKILNHLQKKMRIQQGAVWTDASATEVTVKST